MPASISRPICHETGAPNTPMHPTPLRVDEIERILESDLGSIRTLIYIAARVMGKPLGGWGVWSAGLFLRFVRRE